MIQKTFQGLPEAATEEAGKSGRLTVLAAGAHPDDIEFMMAGTLLRLRWAGAAIHMWNLADGGCGTATEEKEAIRRRRWEEARHSAALAGARLHPPLVEDASIFYDASLLSRVAAVIRRIRPRLILIPSPQDYMEDHQNTARLLVTAAFVRGMRNFSTDPPVEPWEGDTVLYHALPHGLRDGLRRLVRPGQFVDIGPALSLKRSMLACHQSQKEWLDESQGMNAYLNQMEAMSRAVGKMSGRFQHAEGWRRHLHLGLSRTDRDPLKELLGEACRVDAEYEQSLG
ncbi:MAG: PIG-L deacetylase family protein [Acidobacteriota bacterium]